MLSTDQLPQFSLETLLVAFFNCSKSRSGDFIVVSNWREQYGHKVDRRYLETAQALSLKYGLKFEQSGKTRIVARIENPSNLTLAEFRTHLYNLIVRKIPTISPQYPLDSEIALALFLLRGSPDFHLGYYSVDVKELDSGFASEIEKILLSSDQLLDRLNLNFRDLQPQFVAGKVMRNTQIRVNLRWYFDAVVSPHMGLNPYKSDVLASNQQKLGDTRTYKSFENRLKLFRERILGKSLSASQQADLRQELAFDRDEALLEGDEAYAARNQKIIQFAREIFLDECTGCKEKYPVENRTFITPRNGRLFFEINHVIPYAAGTAKVDVLDNLVKLCPACHRALAPRRASDSLQKEIIANMLSSRSEVATFVKGRNDVPDITDVDYVHSQLR